MGGSFFFFLPHVRTMKRPSISLLPFCAYKGKKIQLNHDWIGRKGHGLLHLWAELDTLGSKISSAFFSLRNFVHDVFNQNSFVALSIRFIFDGGKWENSCCDHNQATVK